MSRPHASKPPPSASARRPLPTRSLSATATPRSAAVARRPSISGLSLTGALNPVAGAPKAQRTSKTAQKLVLLPSAPQTRAAEEEAEAELHGYETDRGVRDMKSAGERMGREQRESAGYSRITAYCVAEGFKMKLLGSFLKREHNVQPRVFDEALYAMYHLPLLPGYGPHSNIRSSLPSVSPGAEDPTSGLSEAEEDGYQGTYFNASTSPEAASHMEGYIVSASPVITAADIQPDIRPPPADAATQRQAEVSAQAGARRRRREKAPVAVPPDEFAEAIFFAYGVVVFFGLTEAQERGILEDVENAGAFRRKLPEQDWEVEACHYAIDAHIAFPRIYNDFFTFKTHSHLLKLSVAHALAQSTLLAHYESLALRILASPDTTSIPQQLAATGALALSRTHALRLTGRLFTLRRDVTLMSNVLDVPELFWSEASLKALYDAVREYMEIGGRVQVLNEKLAVAEDLLGAIHDHLNNNAMERITWIIIWLIVVACAVEMGEVIARLVVHESMSEPDSVAVCASSIAALESLSREEALQVLQRIAGMELG